MDSLDDDLNLSDESDAEDAPEEIAKVTEKPTEMVAKDKENNEDGKENKRPVPSNEAEKVVSTEDKIGDNVQFKEEAKPVEEKPEEAKKEAAKASQPQGKKKKQYMNFLEELVGGFRERRVGLERALGEERRRRAEARGGFAYEAHADQLRTQVKLLMGDHSESSYRKMVEAIAGSKAPDPQTMLCDLLYQQLVGEHKDTPLLCHQAEGQPEITRRQQRLFTLLTSLQGREGWGGLVERMARLLRHALFGRERMYHLKVNAVQNIGRLLVLCYRFLDDQEGLRQILYDLFYFKSPRNHILVAVVMALWPDVFPACSPSPPSPLVATLVWCVYNTGPAQRAPEMKVQECKDDFIRIYGYKPNQTKADDLVKRFIQEAEGRPGEEALEELRQCLLLIGRCKEHVWVNNNIVMRLFKSLEAGHRAGDSSQAHMQWVFGSLGLLARVYPAEGRASLTNMFDQMTSLLTSAGASVPPAMEAACIRALVHIGYHLQAQIAIFLRSWEPVHPLDPATSRILQDFVGTRGRKHSQITMQVARKESARARKRQGVPRK